MDYVSLFGNKKISVCPFKLLNADMNKLERILNINNELKCPDHFLSPTLKKITTELDFNIFRLKRNIQNVRKLNDLTDPLLMNALTIGDLDFYGELSGIINHFGATTSDKVEALIREKNKCYRTLLAYTRYNLILLLKNHLETEQIPPVSASIFAFVSAISNRTTHLTSSECIDIENCIASSLQLWSSSSTVKQKIFFNIKEILTTRNKYDFKILKLCVKRLKLMDNEKVIEYCKTNLFNYKVFVNDDLIRLIGSFIHY